MKYLWFPLLIFGITLRILIVFSLYSILAMLALIPSTADNYIIKIIVLAVSIFLVMHIMYIKQLIKKENYKDKKHKIFIKIRDWFVYD